MATFRVFKGQESGPWYITMNGYRVPAFGYYTRWTDAFNDAYRAAKQLRKYV